ncbi:MAG: hypothetical protein HUJ68_03985, partial [Clostridia bacterium]|nr:hypothetical protein [Clostridia bacterium]
NYYFLFIKNLDASNIDFKTFDSIACEFSNNISDDINFKYNLFKYGKLIINKNIFTLCNSDK